MSMAAEPAGFSTSWGAMLSGDGSVRFRIWAPGVKTLALRAAGDERPMKAAGDGWFELVADDLPAGTAYCYVLPDGAAVPDPASRAQAGDVHAPSLVVDPSAWNWRTPWAGRPWEEAVIYELHVGTFTQAGTFAAAAERLPHLAATGVTAVEIMPVAQFAGNRGWGYDGVLPYAPHPAYGGVEGMKAFIDTAHAQGLMVLLDVVYNHFGPEGNYLHLYAEDFFNAERQTPWGAAIDFRKDPVRRFFIDNALYWLTEYRLDGLRLDAIDQIRDPSDTDILIELAERVRTEITDREIHLTSEDNRNVTHLHERDASGGVARFTAEWNDDFHNVAHVIATGETSGYYIDFARDHWTLLARALAEGFAYQGEMSVWTGAPRGVPSGHLPPAAFVDFLQNHDQTGNRAFGERLTALTGPKMLRALGTLFLLSPHVPLLFMGEEYGEVRPFCFFTDYEGDLADAVREGRRREFADFPAFAGDDRALSRVPDPNALSTFEASRLDWRRCAAPEGQAALEQTRELLALRRQHVTPFLAGAGGGAGTILSAADGAMAIDWRLAGALLELRANLTDRPQALAPAMGAQVHATAPGGTKAAPPYWVAVHVRRDDAVSA